MGLADDHDVGPAVASLPKLAWRPVTAVAIGAVGLLTCLAGVQDYHCDELYFRLLGTHLSWGYPDQPPFTPLLARASVLIFGDTAWGIRVLPGMFIGPIAVVCALIAREVGGRAPAQVLAALGTITLFPLASGHIVSTTTPDLLVWALVILFTLRALLRREPRHWLSVGVVVGLGLYNKYLVILLLVGLALALLLVGPRDAVRSRWLWFGVGAAIVIGLPNLVYQVVHGFPQLEMSRSLADTDSATQGEQRLRLLPMQLVLLGPVSAPVWISGIWALLRWPELRRARAIGVAYGVLCVILLAVEGQSYYTPGLLISIYAVGCVAMVRWCSSLRPSALVGRVRRARPALVGGLIVANAGMSVLFAFPPVAESEAEMSPLMAVNILVVNQIGWTTYVEQIATVYQTLTPDERATTTIITAKSWTAGAIDRYGRSHDLPRAYSGHNGLYDLGAPPESATSAVVVGEFESDDLPMAAFARCEVAGSLDNLLGVDNEDQGSPIRVCREPIAIWEELWPRFHSIGV